MRFRASYCVGRFSSRTSRWESSGFGGKGKKSAHAVVDTTLEQKKAERKIGIVVES